MQRDNRRQSFPCYVVYDHNRKALWFDRIK